MWNDEFAVALQRLDCSIDERTALGIAQAQGDAWRAIPARFSAESFVDEIERLSAALGFRSVEHVSSRQPARHAWLTAAVCGAVLAGSVLALSHSRVSGASSLVRSVLTHVTHAHGHVAVMSNWMKNLR